MASMSGKVFVEAEVGPVMRTALDVLDCACEVVVLFPEWQEDADKRELLTRMRGLHETCLRSLRAGVRVSPEGKEVRVGKQFPGGGPN